MAQEPMPPQDGGQAGQGGGGGAAEMLTATDKALFQIASAIGQSPDAPEAAKEHFATALEHFRAGLEALTAEGGGGGGGVAAPEAGGARGAVPESMAGRR